MQQHWNLTDKHNRDIQKIVLGEMELLSQFYGNTTLTNALNNIKVLSKDIMMIVDNIPFYSNAMNENVFHHKLYLNMHYYLFLCTISTYIRAVNELDKKRKCQKQIQ